jgi:hypothetical protein
MSTGNACRFTAFAREPDDVLFSHPDKDLYRVQGPEKDTIHGSAFRDERYEKGALSDRVEAGYFIILFYP